MRILVSAVTVAVLATAALLWWRIEDDYVRFAALFALAELVALSIVVVVAVALGGFLISRLLPGERRAYYFRHKFQYRALLLAAVLAFLVLGYLLNRYWPTSILHPISIAGDIGLLALILWGLWSALVPSTVRALILLPAAAVYALLIFVLLAVSGGRGAASVGVDEKKLGALGYVSWVPISGDTAKVGVSFDDEERSCDGDNIYCSGVGPVTYLMDMKGNILHEWSTELEAGEYFGHAELYPDGDVLVITTGREVLLRLDLDSNVLWMLDDSHYHHDIDIADNGDLYLLARRFELTTLDGLPAPVIRDYLVIRAPDLSIKKELFISDLFDKAIHADSRNRMYRWMVRPAHLMRMVAGKKDDVFKRMDSTPLDLTHTNTVEVLDRDYGGVFSRGAVLVCARNLDLIGVVDVEREELVWSWGAGKLDRPHRPTMLNNGHILIFDNGMHRGYSRVVELDPRSGEIVWDYESSEFFSESRGATERLPNGNTLITNSNSGNVFEVTPEGEIVWEFYNPATRDRFDPRVKKTVSERAAITRMMRITDMEAYPFLRRLR